MITVWVRRGVGVALAMGMALGVCACGSSATTQVHQQSPSTVSAPDVPPHPPGPSVPASLPSSATVGLSGRASLSTTGRASGSPLPVNLPPPSGAATGGQRLVVAHYFPPYPLSLDNLAPNQDYYAQGYLTAGGESGKHRAYGGFLRDRPLPRDPLGGDWQLADQITEVRQARTAGLDGFTVDILGLSGANWERSLRLLRAAEIVSPHFTIIPMPDGTADATKDPSALADAMAVMAKSPAALRLRDGRLVISPFAPEQQGAAWWRSWVEVMRTRHGIAVALVPCFLDYFAHVDAFADFSYGVGNWGNRNPAANDPGPPGLGKFAADAHRRGKLWMQPVSVQDERPYTGVYDEAGNTENLRLTWQAAIDNRAEWVQIMTWNDYSEGTTIAPSVHHGWAFLDLSSYYLAWFRSGTRPAIAREAVYLTHRRQPAGAAPTGGQTRLMTLRPGSTPARDTVEALSLLSAPATVIVQVGTRTTTCQVSAGVSACRAPLAVGRVSVRVTRGAGLVASATSPWLASATLPVQDLQYVAVSSRR